MALPDLSPLFEPRTVAIVGATPDATRMGGGLILHFLQRYGFGGRIVPVNPRHEQIGGLRCFPSLAAIGEPVDLAVFVVPAEALERAIADVPPGSVRIALVLTSGYAEVGDDGARRERALLAAVRRHGARLVGPNSVGVVNLGVGLVATISQVFDRRVDGGDIALVSQSGAFGTALLARAEQEGIGFRHFVSSGNEADLEFHDYGAALCARDEVRAVCGYIESIRNGPGFIALARRALALGKPLIVLKAGTSEAGSRAAKSHTGALVGSDAVAQAVFDAYGVQRAHDGEELIDLLKIFGRTPRSKGRRLAILSHSGGAAVMATDAAEAGGARLPALPEAARAKLATMLPGYAAVANPLDMTGAASLQGKLMADCLRVVLADDAYDAALLCVNLIWRDGPTLLAELDALASETDKPFAVAWVAPAAEVAERLRAARFPTFSDPARGARALSARLAYDEASRAWAARSASSVSAEAVAAPRIATGVADLVSTMAGQEQVLRAYGISLPRQVLACSLDDAEAFRATIGGRPVVVKIAAADLAHRTEFGGVRVGVRTADELARAFHDVLENVRRTAAHVAIEGVLIQEQVADGIEVIVGARRDPVFGPVVAVGLGGTLVELVGDVAVRPAPLDPAGAAAMLTRTALSRLLDGYRGRPAADREALVVLLTRVSRLAADHTRVAEVEFNPVIVLPRGRGCVVVDYKFRVEDEGGGRDHGEPERRAAVDG